MSVSDTRPVLDLPALTKHCNHFKQALWGPALFQLTTTLLGYLALVALVLTAYAQGHIWLAIGLMLPAAGFLVRLFIIQHDCGHGSFTPSRAANKWIGRLISLLTFTPYDQWRKSHAIHHQASGNLDRRCVGSIDTLTVAEYQALPLLPRLKYRLFRNPAILLLIGGPLHTLILQRFAPASSISYMHDYHPLPPGQAWPSVLGLNAMLVLVYALFIYFFGAELFFLAYLPIVVMTAWAGGWLFYIQHQFEHTFWAREGQWRNQEAALYGSSYYVLPPVVQWFTGNIGLHHLHHFCSHIPNYRLQACVDGSPFLQQLNRLGFIESLRCLRWALWDDARQAMIAFRDLKTA